jgi:hypothetical protein
MTRKAVAVTVLVLALLTGPMVASAAGPPATLTPSLTPNGRVIWNLDALLNDTFGDRTDCWAAERAALFSVPRGSECPPYNAGQYEEYVFTFLNARGSQFYLVKLAKAPNTGATNNPITVDNRYVACPNGEYHHGGEGWLVDNGGAGPNGFFWCN